MYQRLNNSICYEAGPMDSDREAGRAWRVDITPFLESLSINVYNPYHKPLQDEEGTEDDENHRVVQQALKDSDFDLVESRMKVIRHVDLRMVDKADFLVVNLDWTKKQCGTIREILEASAQQKPIIVHLEQPIYEQPPWLFSELDYRLWFTDWEELKKYILHIHEDEVVDKRGKWVFFER